MANEQITKSLEYLNLTFVVVFDFNKPIIEWLLRKKFRKTVSLAEISINLQ